MIQTLMKWVFFVALMYSLPGYAQNKQKDKSKGKAPALATVASADSTKRKGPVSMQDTLKAFQYYPGLFDMYQDTLNGSLLLKLKADQVGKEYIYFSHTADGVLPSGHHRGSFRMNLIFSVQRYYNRIELVLENTGYYFDTLNAVSRSAGANINRPVLASLKILKEDKKTGEILIAADPIFMAETFDPVKDVIPAGQAAGRFDPGKFNKDKSKYSHIRNYPENTDVVVEYVYDNAAPQNEGGKEVTDARSVTIKLQHSLIEVPPAGYTPRRDDPRAGYFMTQVEDMTATDATPYRDVIHRWRLEKKNPEAAKSEVVKPITWWIENTTPVEFRATIRAAGLKWNEAFEAAGFINAVEIKEQPDDADWDAGDIRYNVLRWTSSPQPPFGGYGPSFVNPRSGEILGADIMLEYIFITNRLQQERIYTQAALFHDAEHEADMENPHMGYCSLGHQLHQSTLFGSLALDAMNIPDPYKSEYIKSALYYLVMHEMGHTLGLMHNMKASQLWSPEELQDRNLTESIGLVGSVMDYPTPNISPNPAKQGQYFTTRPGPYDVWVITYGYANKNENELQQHLNLSTQARLTFGNDADDMRSPGKAIDPRVMVNDLSNDAIRYAADRMDLINRILPELKTKMGKPGDSWHEFRNAYLLLSGEYANSARVISRYIGGVYVDRGFSGQEGAVTPYRPVSFADQERAMKMLADKVLSPAAFQYDAEIFSYLQMQRRGFNFFSAGEDPKIHARVMAIQKEVFAHVLHPSTLQRITDSYAYGNSYTLDKVFKALTDAVFVSDIKGNVNTFRQNLQQEYTEQLIQIVKLENKSRYDHISRSQAYQQLRTIAALLKGNIAGDGLTQAHKSALAWKISKALEDKG